MSALHGLVPILATPFTPEGDLDVDSLRRLVRFQLTAAVDAVSVFGMASEAFALDSEDRRRVLASTVEEVDGRCSVVAGVNATGLRPALEQARIAVDGGADALMVLPPYLVAPTEPQLQEFFGSIAQHAQVPVMIQDAPAVTGVAIAPAVLRKLTADPDVDYVKVERQPTARKVAEAVEAVDGQAAVFGGQNALFLLEELDRGAKGTMPACEMSDVLRDILDARSAGDYALARHTFDRLLPLLRYGLQPGLAWAVHKAVLVRRGIIAHETVRAPAQVLDAESRQGLEVILDDLKLPSVTDLA